MNAENMNAEKWISEAIAAKAKTPMPVLSFPGVQIIGKSVSELVRDGALQARCMKAIADRYETLAAVTLMDLSVEAEAFGAPIAFSEMEVPTVTGRIVEDETGANGLGIPDVGAGRTGEYAKTVREAKKLIADRPVLAGAIGPFSLAGRLLDMTEIMVLSITEPDTVRAMLEKTSKFIVAYVGALKSAGADGVIFAEPAAGLLSPLLNREFSAKYMREIVAAVKDEHFAVIYHNCGNTIPLIEDILAIGAHGLHFGNAIKLSDMLPLVPPDVAVFGNIDPARQFRNGTPESVRESTLETLAACAAYPNYIPSSGCDIPAQTPLENIDAFFGAVAEFYANPH
ncbi:MAG: uroporphyrinogen decarboxylase family protein [Clostridiales bacterium]|nr:uroporphyrinogen decarboxylase family protein [Clostridiales bacterium]